MNESCPYMTPIFLLTSTFLVVKPDIWVEKSIPVMPSISIWLATTVSAAMSSNNPCGI